MQALERAWGACRRLSKRQYYAQQLGTLNEESRPLCSMQATARCLLPSDGQASQLRLLQFSETRICTR